MKKRTVEKKNVLVGLSGGVDSAVCAWLLKKQGYEVTGIHFLMSGASSLEKAQKIADHLKISLLVEDITEEFQSKIVDDFIEKYAQGETPNPCVICNAELKYQKLIEFADKNGIDRVATGHYARIVFDDGKYALLKGIDLEKDQSYFLYRLSSEQLARMILPLGELEKNEVKKISEGEGIPIQGGESQDVCFFAKQENLVKFLEKRLQSHPGKIVDENGARLGNHSGVEFFTIGQRHGLNLGGNGPYYVYGKDLKNSIVKVTSNPEHQELFSSEIVIGNVSWIGEVPKERTKYVFRARYQTKGSLGLIGTKQKGDDQKTIWKIVLEESQWAVAKGQSLVVFDGEKVIGGGIIM